jgi:hypothetical protein
VRFVQWSALLLACTPIIAALVHALVDDWYPIGDNAYFVVRARDVLTPHHPLLGAWSSGSSSLEHSVNSLGPLQLDLLAPFARIAPAAGTAIGVAVVQTASVIGIWTTLRRLTNVCTVVVAMAAAISIEWSMGSAMLVETRQHHYLVLPFLCLLVLTWAVSAGALWALPWATFVGSLVVQTHLSYVLLVSALAAFGLASAGLVMWRQRRDDPVAWTAFRPGVRRIGAISAVVAAVCWIQPLIDQFAARGNLGTLLSAGSDRDPTGPGTGARIVATVLTRPPFWLRPEFRQFDPNFDLLDTTYTALSMTILAVVLVVTTWFTWRRQERFALADTLTAVVAVVAAIGSASTLNSSFGLTAGNYRWLWSIGGFIVIVVSNAALTRWIAARAEGDRPVTVATVGGLTVAALLAVLAVPYSYQLPGPDERAQIAVTRTLLAQLDDFDTAGPVIYDRARAAFSEPYTYPLLVKLQERGIEFDFDDPRDVRRFGDEREADGEATRRLSLVVPDLSGRAPSDGTLVASLPGLPPEMQGEHHALYDTIVSGIETGRIGVDLDAARSATGAALDQLERLIAGRPVERAGLTDELVAVGRHRAVDANADDLADIDRWLTLHDRSLMWTVGLYLTPVS